MAFAQNTHAKASFWKVLITTDEFIQNFEGKAEIKKNWNSSTPWKVKH